MDDVVFRDKPVKKPFRLKKRPQKVETVRYCQKDDCDYKMAVEPGDVTSDAAETTAATPDVG